MSSIDVEGVSVSFPLYGGMARSLKNRIMSSATGGRVGSDRRSRTVIQALEDINFSVQHGERVALVGHNGAGKTTLLRVLSGIYPPLAGRLVIDGRVAPIFDIGLGMDPEATGYDNIRIRGLYLGLTRKEIEAKIPEIAEFTELGPFLDMPMRTYSAGMQTRLSFAVSTSVDPEILLLDEGIGAGDASFMERARERLRGFVERSGILVLASHDAGLLARLCSRAIRLEHGRIVDDGPFDDVMERFGKATERHLAEQSRDATAAPQSDSKS
ncbi:ABC transporter ATP-binding protein [Enterovirga rhinocerotis]|uniref:ABC-2 type transport system ATP-binding protein/lipopolysaccharide transport system ATP-binding protein n=1 Tax=Enterovirga rhinocerotis TaxID=1339210 RepID=A0A4R7C4D8_9HYPH|nr:ABC transporter ATP-binding protein [Enterovirga rhinocerotis]TDR93248.1 ABC-2 type transport system ATP-binding protein/lipopolysaccharide transport system ATP-binding protein [Enterovirga rhinocerotis]